jgi:uncharacterized protein (TIGR03437 family)
MVSYHLYPAGWEINDGSDAAIYIRRHEEIARNAGKVAYFGEYGKRAADRSPGGCNLTPGRAFDAQRAQVYQAWLGYSAIEQATSGAMVWQLINDGKDDCEGFQVYCPLDAQSCEVLRQVSDRIAASPVAVSAATYQPVTLAAGSIASLFGTDLSGTQLVLVDGKGRTYEAAIFFNSAGQINFQIPENMPPGVAVIRVVRDGATRTSSAMMVSEVEPGLFTAGADGRGLAAGLAVVVDKDGARRIQFLTTPIVIPAEGVVVLSLFGTGMRGTKASATVKGLTAEVLYAGPQREFAGLDQVNLQLPAGSSGAGEVDVELTVDGKKANVVRVAIQ